MPLPFDVLVGAETEPPMAVQFTTTPDTGVLFWSRTSTDSGASVARTVSVWLFPALRAIWVAPWICATALNVTGEPTSPALVAVVVWAPAVAPSVRMTAATPPASVTLDAALTEPPPDAAAQLTAMPWTPAPVESLTITERGVASAVPAAPTGESPPSSAMVFAVCPGWGPP